MTVAALTAVSCQKEKEIHPVGSRIVFSAATEFRNGLETRTLYTGQYTQTDPAFERIQWVSTDQIKILYSHGSSSSATYSIDESSIAGSGTEKKSTASISVASGSSALEWAEGSSHIFYGLYPADGGTLTAGSATGLTIPATQTVTWNADQSKYLPDMDKAYMVSYKDMSSTPNSTVDLPFTPVMNAVEFKLRLPDDRPSYTVTQVKFSASASTAIAGTYSVNITGFADDAVTWSVPNNGITSSATGILINFNNGSSSTNPAIPTSTSGNVLDFTVLTLPVSFSDPVLQIKYSDGHVLKVTLTGLSLQAGQKCIVSNSKAGHDDFTYVVSTPASQTITGHNAASFSQISVSSLKRSGANSSYTEPVAWKVQYTTDNGTTWTDGVPSTHTLTEDHTNNTFTVALAAANAATEYDNNKTPFDAATEILRARSSVGSASAPYDLSTHALDGSIIEQSAANCYVVTRPGVYKFPLIYGNARLLGADNPSAYSPKDVPAINSTWASQGTDAEQNYYLPAFYNAVGDVIDSPYILTDLGNIFGRSATVAGLNGSGSPSVHFDNNHGANDGILTNLSVQGSGSSAYIQFEVTQANIKPGNVRLLLEGSVVVQNQSIGIGVGDTYPILWSWHIWVTDKDLAPSNSIMPFNLGWVDANTTVYNSVSKYTNRTVELRIAQVEGGSEVNYGTAFTLTQTGDVASINNPLDGTNPHYQWGRKDPYAASSSTVPLTQHNDAGESTGYWYWRGIRIPEVMLRSEKSTTWMDGKAIPLYKSSQSQVFDHNDYYIKPTSQKTGPFTTAQKNGLAAVAPFNNGVTFTQERIIDNYTLAAGTYGPFTNKSTIESILGSSGWTMKKRVANNATFIQYFSHELYDYSPTYTGVPLSYWSNVNNYFYYFADGVILTTAQLNAISTTCTNVGQRTEYGVAMNNYSMFETYCLENIHYITLSSPVTVTTSQKNTLVGQGISSSSFTENSHLGDWYLTANGGVYPSGPYTEAQRNALVATGVFTNNDFNAQPQYNTVTSYTYTTDPERALGSILHNLWNAALYNETASVSKYKTVYDPCPAGFTVPTKATYSSGTFTGYPRTGMRVNSGGTSATTSVSDSGTKGYYWTDHSCNMSYNSGAKDVITSYTDYDKSYILETTSSTASVKKNIRATAASIRPMTDPRASSIAGHATPAQVSASNPIESVTMGPEL